MAQVQGHCDPKFENVKQLMQTFIDTGEEYGTSFVVNIDGENVIDIWGGYVDEAKTKAWDKDSITNVWSTTKTVSALATLMLVDRGLLDVNEKVSKYWPEFTGDGREEVEVRHFLSHTSGFSGWDEKITGEQAADFDYAVAKLAQQKPWWKPGTASGYHSLTMGHLLGELVRRTTGKSMKQFVAEELAGPLGADFQIGCLEKDWPRIADIVPFDVSTVKFPPFEPDSVMAKTMMNPIMDASKANAAYWRKADLGAGNGHGNARSVARILSTIPLGGVVDGHKVISPGTIELIFQQQSRGVDLAIGQFLRFGIGYGLVGDGECAVDDLLPTSEKICFWGGWGGSMIIMDVGRKMTIAYVMNKMSNVGLGNVAGRAFVKAVYRALGVEK